MNTENIFDKAKQQIGEGLKSGSLHLYTIVDPWLSSGKILARVVDNDMNVVGFCIISETGNIEVYENTNKSQKFIF